MQLSRDSAQLVCHQVYMTRWVLPPADGLLCCACAGISALTMLSRLTRLACDGFGVEVLAMKVTGLLQSLGAATAVLHVDEHAVCRRSGMNRVQAALGHSQHGAMSIAHIRSASTAMVVSPLPCVRSCPPWSGWTWSCSLPYATCGNRSYGSKWRPQGSCCYQVG